MLYSNVPPSATYLFAAMPRPSQTSSQALERILRGLVRIVLFLMNGYIESGRVFCGSHFVNISIPVFRVANVSLASEFGLRLNALVSSILIYYIS